MLGEPQHPAQKLTRNFPAGYKDITDQPWLADVFIFCQFI